jgi:RHS repeat-associated protein
VDASGNVINFYSLGATLVKRRNPSGATYPQEYLHLDEQGTVVIRSGADGAPTTSVLDPDPWGGHLGGETSALAWLGDLGYFSEPGLQRPLFYVNARWYVGSGPGWLSKDPWQLRGREVNLYRYALNRPLVRTDPSGTSIGPRMSRTRLFSYIPGDPFLGWPNVPTRPAEPCQGDAWDYFCICLKQKYDCCVNVVKDWPKVPKGGPMAPPSSGFMFGNQPYDYDLPPVEPPDPEHEPFLGSLGDWPTYWTQDEGIKRCMNEGTSKDPHRPGLFPECHRDCWGESRSIYLKCCKSGPRQGGGKPGEKCR